MLYTCTNIVPQLLGKKRSKMQNDSNKAIGQWLPRMTAHLIHYSIIHSTGAKFKTFVARILEAGMWRALNKPKELRESEKWENIQKLECCV